MTWTDRLVRLEELRGQFSSRAVVSVELLLGGDLEGAMRLAREYRQIEREHAAELELAVSEMKQEQANG